MAAFDNTKYDIALYPQADARLGYRLKSYQKSEFSPFIPRLGSGDQSESEFDAIKSMTFKGFEGGQFSRSHDDDVTQYAIEGMFPVYGDGRLWQTPRPTQSATYFGSGRPYVTAHCRTKDYTFVAVSQTTGGTAQRVYRIDSAGTKTSLTLPVALSALTHTVTDMVIHDNQLWLCASSPSGASGSMYYMDLTSTTVNDIAAGTGYYYQLVVWNGALYGTNVGSVVNHELYKYTGNTTTRSFQLLATIPTKTGDYTADMQVYNGRIILSRIDGLYSYDGIRLAPIEDATDSPNLRNFRFMCKLKGYLYYWMPDGMYRYNGSSIEKMYDVNDVGFPIDMISAKNRLWVVFANSASTGSSRYDKSVGYDFSSGTSFDARLCAFDGKGMYTYTRMTTQTKAGVPMLNNEGEPYKLIYSPAANKIFISTFADPNSTHWILDLTEASVTPTGSGAASWQIITPVLDCKFPMVSKALASIELLLDGVPTADDTVVVQYRITGFDGSSNWSTLSTISLQSKLKLDVFRDFYGGVTFKYIQLRIRPNTTTNTACGISKVVVRYILMPDYKYEWLLTLNCYGDDPTQPLMLADGTQSTQSVSTLRGNIYNSKAQTQPLIYVDVDQLLLAADLTTGALFFTLDDGQLLKPSGYIMVNDEVLYYSSKNVDTFFIATRGCFGTTANNHAAASKVFATYPTIIKRITADRVSIDDRGTDFATDKARMSEITIQLQEL